MYLIFVLAGWFEVEQKGWEPNHSCHSNVGEISKTKCKEFLVRTTVICHLGADNNNDGEFQVGPETRIHPGEILKVVDVITKKWKTKAVGTDKKGKGPELSTKFLQCIDKQTRRVYLPFAHPGEFYPLWDSDNKNKTPKSNYAYYIHDLLGFGFPLCVRIVFGWPPADFEDFSGFLRLLGVSRPDTLVLRNLKPATCVITEIPIDCDVKIERIQDGNSLVKGNSFQKLLAHSCDRIYPYLIGMKHMDTRYPVLPPNMHKEEENEEKSPDSTTPPPSNQNKNTCRMARPRDMRKFDTMDVFPPLQEPIRQMADSWTFSFKDPNYTAGDSDLRDSESIIVDPETDSSSRLSSVSGCLDSDLKGIKISDEPYIPRREQMLQRRAQIEQVFDDREADC